MTVFCATAIEKPSRAAYSRGVQLQSGKKSGTVFPDRIMEASGVRHRFTLIELLTVIGIASVVMALAIPAFTHMVAGNKVDEMAGRLKLGLEQAQSIAATENRYVALILPNGSDTDTDTDVHPYRRGGFRPAFLTKYNGKFYFDRWVDGHDWTNAPDQAVLLRILDGDKNSRKILPNTGTPDYEVSSAADMGKGIKGFPESLTNSYTEGYEISGSSTVHKDYTNTGMESFPSSLPNPLPPGVHADPNCGSHNLVIFNPRGGIMNGSDLYFVVAAAKISGNDVSYPAKDSTGPVDYRILMLHQYTGRVEFK